MGLLDFWFHMTDQEASSIIIHGVKLYLHDIHLPITTMQISRHKTPHHSVSLSQFELHKNKGQTCIISAVLNYLSSLEPLYQHYFIYRGIVYQQCIDTHFRKVTVQVYDLSLNSQQTVQVCHLFIQFGQLGRRAGHDLEKRQKVGSVSTHGSRGQ